MSDTALKSRFQDKIEWVLNEVSQAGAEADLLVELAKASKEKMLNDALKSPGVDRRVGLEMAETLKGLEVVILPSAGQDGINPLDLNSMVNLFGVSGQDGA